MARKYEIISKLAEETAKEVQKPAVKSVSKAPETKKETSAEKAKEELGWTAEYGIKEMCEDSWRWQSNNPQGYEE